MVSVWRGFLLGWATLFYCGTPRAFHIIISKLTLGDIARLNRTNSLNLELGKVVDDFSQHEHVLLEFFIMFDTIINGVCLPCF